MEDRVYISPKTYKEIADIIAKYTITAGITIWKSTGATEFIENLADYFDKTEKEYWGKLKVHPNNFNRKQFFKDCGMK